MSIETKHTPGPWVAQKDTGSFTKTDFVIGTDGAAIDSICNCDEHNASLIAAAPDLLAALRDILRIATAASGGVTGNQPRLDRARAAIAKATGGVA